MKYYECVIPRLDHHSEVIIHVAADDIAKAENAVIHYYEENLQRTYGEFTGKVFESSSSSFWWAYTTPNLLQNDHRVIFG